VAATITAEGFRAPTMLVQNVGTLLISTLTSVKHAGAAFAARDSLLEIATACMSPSQDQDIGSLPRVWTKRLLEEISLNEKVRDSTLRRSTGYALGFLAIMRSEMASKSGPSSLCPWVLENILMYSLPSEEQVRDDFENLHLSSEISSNPAELFSTSSGTSRRFFVPYSEYEVSSCCYCRW
jgi:hypothetical protein